MSKEKDIEFLGGNFVYLFELFVVLKELRGLGKEKIGSNLHKVLFSSVVRNFILGLANLLDPVEDNNGNKNISIHVINIDLVQYEEITKKVRTFRSKVIAHNDRTVMHEGEDFFVRYNLKLEDVETLFEHILTVFEQYSQHSFAKEKKRQDLLLEFRELFH